MPANITRRKFIIGGCVMGASIMTTGLLSGCSPTAQSQQSEGTSSNEESNAEQSGTTANDIARPSTHGELTVQGTQLIGASGQTAQLKGFSTHGLAWFPQYVNQECFTQLSEWGANVARLAMYTHENGGYCTDGNQEELRNLLKQGVEFAAKANMYCIVDWHVLQDLNPNAYLQQAKEFWQWASSEFANASNVIFEICNEPNGSTTWEEVKQYAETILPIIRANAPKKAVLVGTPRWCQQPDLAAANPIADENVMYTLHFYAGTHKEDLRSTLRSVVQGGTPVFVSEYGICDASGNGALDLESANTWTQLMDDLDTSYVCWNLSNKAESSSFIASGCNKTSGFTDEDLTPCGTWIKGMLAGTAPRETASASGEGSGAEALTLSSITSSNASPSANLRQRWETNGKPYLLFDITLTADNQVSSWDATLEFTAPVALSDSWNCAATVDGQTVRLAPASYNANIAAQQKIQDVGIIVYPA